MVLNVHRNHKANKDGENGEGVLGVWRWEKREITGEVIKYTWCSTSTETIRLIRDGRMGRGGMEVEEEGD